MPPQGGETLAANSHPMDLERVEAVLRLLSRQEHVGEISVEAEGWRLRAVRGRTTPPAPLLEPPSKEEQEESSRADRQVIRAGVVGIYRAPHASLRPADHVPRGGLLGNIDSMRILNPITAAEGGYVVEVLVDEGDPVEYGQELFVLSPEPVVPDS